MRYADDEDDSCNSSGGGRNSSSAGGGVSGQQGFTNSGCDVNFQVNSMQPSNGSENSYLNQSNIQQSNCNINNNNNNNNNSQTIRFQLPPESHQSRIHRQDGDESRTSMSVRYGRDAAAVTSASGSCVLPSFRYNNKHNNNRSFVPNRRVSQGGGGGVGGGGGGGVIGMIRKRPGTGFHPTSWLSSSRSAAGTASLTFGTGGTSTLRYLPSIPGHYGGAGGGHTGRSRGSVLRNGGMMSTNGSVAISFPNDERNGARKRFLQPQSSQVTNRMIWAIRAIFVFLLICVAVALGVAGHYIVQNAEQSLGEQQFYNLASRALDIGEELAVRRRVVVKGMAQIAGSAFAKKSQWPNVAIPAFETIAQDLMKTSGNADFGFYPMVVPKEVELQQKMRNNQITIVDDESDEEYDRNNSKTQQELFEEFAYDYFHYGRHPPFPPNTAVHNFGKGIWRAQNTMGVRPGVTETLRSHDTSGVPYYWNSSNAVLFPELQNSFGDDILGRVYLMLNIHSIPSKGQPLDEVLECAQQRKRTQEHTVDCGVVTSIFSWNRESFLIQPIYPARDMLDLAGVIVSRVSWDVIIERMFAEHDHSNLVGITVVLESEGKSYSYKVKSGGSVELIGDGDLHDPNFDYYARTTILSGEILSGASSREYHLTIYPSQAFFDLFATSSPVIATVGALLIVFLTSLMFFLYDFFVRREFDANRKVLQAKRQFMRFVSHEVRTPLNAVCLGLTLFIEDLESFFRNTAPDGKINAKETCSAVPAVKDTEGDDFDSKVSEWLTLAEEIRSSATVSVDVLNDLLNYDKIESGTFSLELTTFSIWNLVIETSSEFRLSAKKKDISFVLDFAPLLGEEASEHDHLESFDDSMIPKDLRNLKVVADRIRITQMLRNLVSNALKFTPEHGQVIISLSTIPASSQVYKKSVDVVDRYILKTGEEVALPVAAHVKIQVTDTGTGLSQDQLNRIFKQGVQFNVNELQAGQGSGLGLYISKGIASQHKGSLNVSSEGIGKGTSFACTLPLYCIPDDDSFMTAEVLDKLDEVHEENVSQRETGSDQFLPLRLLIVDDVANNRTLLKRLAISHGYTADLAENGKDALQKVMIAMNEGNPYDSILMDYEMPVLRGPEATKEIRAMGCDWFIVGITGNLLAEDIKYFMNCGANHVLPKPVNFRKLEELWAEYGVSGHASGNGRNDNISPVFEIPDSIKIDRAQPLNLHSNLPKKGEKMENSSEKVSTLRLLIVDDVTTNRKLLKRLASKRGHLADEAKDGREAVLKVEEAMSSGNPYDSILMDCEMPILRGPEATKKIRELGCSWVIIGVTGNVSTEDVKFFIECGADHVLAKPVVFSKLEEIWSSHGL